VTALVGSSVNFTWSFSGDVDQVYWGVTKAGVKEIDAGGLLVSLDVNGTLARRSCQFQQVTLDE